MAKLNASTFRVKNITTLLEGIIAEVQKAVAKSIENQDFEYLLSWKGIEMAQSNTCRHLLTKIETVRTKALDAGKDAEDADRDVVALLIAEAWKLSMGTCIHNSTASTSNLTNEAKIELGRRILLALGVDSYYLQESVAAAILNDVAPYSGLRGA
jgi:microcompartment protein CcmL/EutN